MSRIRTTDHIDPTFIGKILARAEDIVVRQIEADAGSYSEHVESPIEAAMAMALCVVFDRFPWRKRKWDLFDKNSPIRLRPQHQIGPYRVDFLLTLDDVSPSVILKTKVPQRSLVIECDGHEFHERSKEQAAADRARDRYLQTQGYTVFRFTGSEIWNDPLKCADQVYDWVCDAAIASGREEAPVA